MSKSIIINDRDFKEIIAESIKGVLSEQQRIFNDTFSRVLDFHKSQGKKYGFELLKDGRWVYGDIKYNPSTHRMSCMGVSIQVLPNMTLLDAEEDLFEALLDAGYEASF